MTKINKGDEKRELSPTYSFTSFTIPGKYVKLLLRLQSLFFLMSSKVNLSSFTSFKQQEALMENIRIRLSLHGVCDL